MKNSYDFPVKLQEVSSKGILIPEKAAVVREDTNKVIGVVSKKYGLLYHKDIIDSFRESLNGIKYDENIKLTKEGARLFAIYTLPDVKSEIEKGDIVSLRFVTTNSYDGSKLFHLMLGAYRLVCENGMIIGNDLFSLSQRHIGKTESLKESFEASHSMSIKETISKLISSFKESIPTMQQMQQTPVKKDEETLFNRETTKLPKYLLNLAKKEFSSGKEKTIWSFYNSLTAVINHNQRKDNIDRKLFFLKQAWTVANQEMLNSSK